MISGERKKFEIKARRSVKYKHPLLSNTVAYLEDERQGFCYISFDESLVEFVGTKLPRGVAPFDPAYLYVVQTMGTWTVYARYVKDDIAVPLWGTHTRPLWLKASIGGTHGNARTEGSEGAGGTEGTGGNTGTQESTADPQTPARKGGTS